MPVPVLVPVPVPVCTCALVAYNTFISLCQLSHDGPGLTSPLSLSAWLLGSGTTVPWPRCSWAFNVALSSWFVRSCPPVVFPRAAPSPTCPRPAQASPGQPISSHPVSSSHLSLSTRLASFSFSLHPPCSVPSFQHALQLVLLLPDFHFHFHLLFLHLTISPSRSIPSNSGLALASLTYLGLFVFSEHSHQHLHLGNEPVRFAFSTLRLFSSTNSGPCWQLGV